ncbi:MAG: ABC-type transport auxiliary lipoprotein family protein [Burkholderiales bacterium]
MKLPAMRMHIPPGWLAAAALSLALSAGCAALTEVVKPAPLPVHYSLSYTPAHTATPAPSAAAAPILIVSPPQAAAGFDSSRMMYVRHINQLEYFAFNQWIDAPARMLEPLIVSAAEATGAFRAVVPTPSLAGGELRLDTQILRLQQEFLETPSRVRFTLRAYLLENATHRVVASREFEAVAAAPTEDGQGGAAAANQATRKVLEELAAFCAKAAGGDWKRSSGGEVPQR